MNNIRTAICVSFFSVVGSFALAQSPSSPDAKAKPAAETPAPAVKPQAGPGCCEQVGAKAKAVPAKAGGCCDANCCETEGGKAKAAPAKSGDCCGQVGAKAKEKAVPAKTGGCCDANCCEMEGGKAKAAPAKSGDCCEMAGVKGKAAPAKDFPSKVDADQKR